MSEQKGRYMHTLDNNPTINYMMKQVKRKLQNGYVAKTKDLVTGREIWLPTGNRVSRAPTVTRVTEQKILILFEIFEFELNKTR
jgi:hypothetical protein